MAHNRNQNAIAGGFLAAYALTKQEDHSLTPAQTPSRVRFGPGGVVYRIITTADESLGCHFAFEAIEPPGGGPQLHIHATEDEYFFVLEGEINFYLDGRVVVAKPGGVSLCSAGTPHCFRNCSMREARVLVLFTPGTIEGFFDYGLPLNGEMPSDDHLLNRIVDLAPRYGLEVLGASPL